VPTPVPIPLDDGRLQELAEMLRLLGEPNRLRIVLACLGGPRAAGELAAEARITLSLASHHLRLLRAARLLKSERHGKHVLYMPADEHVLRVLADLVAHVQEDAP